MVHGRRAAGRARHAPPPRSRRSARRCCAQRLDVSKAAEVEALGAAVAARFGAPHFVFNNAGVGAGGLIWESTLKDWEWVLGVNLMGVVHGVRVFTPMMLEAAQQRSGYEGHIINTASMAGLVNMPNMGVYNVTKHAVVVAERDAVPGPARWSPTRSAHRCCARTSCRPASSRATATGPPSCATTARPTKSQLVGKAMSEKAVGSGKVSAAAGRAVRVRRDRERPLLRLQPPEGAGERADAARGHRAGAQPDRSVRRQAGDRRRAEEGAARRPIDAR